MELLVHWLPVKQRIDFKILLITYKALNGQAPTYITDLFTFLLPSSKTTTFVYTKSA